MTENVPSVKNMVTSIFGVKSKLPCAEAEPDPIRTGWMVRNSRIERKVIGTLIDPIRV